MWFEGAHSRDVPVVVGGSESIFAAEQRMEEGTKGPSGKSREEIGLNIRPLPSQQLELEQM